LTQFRFRGGVANQGEQLVFEIWDSTNSQLIEALAFTPGLTGIHDWAIEYDCYPNCDDALGEVALANPIIIPPTGILKVRSTRTIGTLAGAAFT
jgi:phenylalanyl-tRNA synthetase beta subunit